MKFLWIAGGTALALAAAGLAAGQIGLGPMASREAIFLAACDEVIKERLRSPATYHRVEATSIQRSPGDMETFLRLETPEKREKQQERERENPEFAAIRERLEEVFKAANYDVAVTVITYDAENAYGTPVRDRAICSDYMVPGAPLEVDRFAGPRINNMTSQDWHISQIEALTLN